MHGTHQFHQSQKQRKTIAFLTRRLRESLTPTPAIVAAVTADSLTYLEPSALRELYDHVRWVESHGVEGVLIEAGCALGGSAIVIAAAKSRSRPLYVYDVFGMIPPPAERDGPTAQERYAAIKSGQSPGIGGNRYYGYEDDLLGKVRENFVRCGISPQDSSVHLIQGLFQDTLQIDEPVAFAHLDGDWYESTMTCLERIEPHLVSNGVIVVDDYDAWSGARQAVDEYFHHKRGVYRFSIKSRLHITRK